MRRADIGARARRGRVRVRNYPTVLSISRHRRRLELFLFVSGRIRVRPQLDRHPVPRGSVGRRIARIAIPRSPPRLVVPVIVPRRPPVPLDPLGGGDTKTRDGAVPRTDSPSEPRRRRDPDPFARPDSDYFRRFLLRRYYHRVTISGGHRHAGTKISVFAGSGH